MPGGGLQPHRKGGPLRQPGQAMDAMRRGADAQGQNPADLQRQAQASHGAFTAARQLHYGQARKSRASRAARPSR